jgi:hypothetical protein
MPATPAALLEPLKWGDGDALGSSWSGDAAVSVSIVHVAKGTAVRSVGEIRLDHVIVASINSRLRPKPERPDPAKLLENRGKSFQGSIVLGEGFLLTEDERAALVQKEPRNASRIFRYIGGEDINTSPTHDSDRYVISFGSMSQEEAGQWPLLLDIVKQKVKPERDRLKNNSDGRRRKTFWWQFGRWTPALYAAVSSLRRCIVTSIVSKHLLFSFQPTDRIFSHKVCVFPFESAAALAVLQSRVHEPWAWLLSSTMRNDINYSPSDCFETFPFPPDPSLAPDAPLEQIGQRLYEARAQYMLDTNQGLTKTYNALKGPAHDDPRIAALRALHLEMDRAVLDAYGWTDIAVPPYTTPQTADEKAARQAFEDEVIDRLFALNAERAAEERKVGGPEQAAPSEPTPVVPKPRKDDQTLEMFADGKE